MKTSFDETRIRDIWDSARNCRMKQLESDFAAWQEYAAEVKTKEELVSSLEGVLTSGGRTLLQKYDDVTSLMVCKAQDYFYKQGFTDCLNLVRLIQGGIIEEIRS